MKLSGHPTKPLQNQDGVSLVELMIAAAVLSILALAFSGYMRNVTTQQKNAQENMDMMVLNGQLNAAAIDPQSVLQSGTLIRSSTTTTTTTTNNPYPIPDNRQPMTGQTY